jgi:TetR/AcrR family tetracycline transcriptional repressor
MAKQLSRLDRLKAAAKAHAAAEMARLEERAAAGDPKSKEALDKIRGRDALIRERIERTRQRQIEKQRVIHERIERHMAQRGRPQGRRGRVQPQDVIAAALELLDERGVDGVTLRDVAARLRVQAPALYWHFAGKSDIVDGMAHAMLTGFVDELEMPTDPAEWRTWMRQAAHGLRSAMLSHRDGARIVAGAGLGRARSLAVLIEKMLAVLEQAGFDPVTASAGGRAVISYSFGAVIEEQSPIDVDVTGPQIQEFLKEFPGIAKSIDAQLRLSPQAQFDLGLELILRGLDTRR